MPPPASQPVGKVDCSGPSVRVCVDTCALAVPSARWTAMPSGIRTSDMSVRLAHVAAPGTTSGRVAVQAPVISAATAAAAAPRPAAGRTSARSRPATSASRAAPPNTVRSTLAPLDTCAAACSTTSAPCNPTAGSSTRRSCRTAPSGTPADSGDDEGDRSPVVSPLGNHRGSAAVSPGAPAGARTSGSSSATGAPAGTARSSRRTDPTAVMRLIPPATGEVQEGRRSGRRRTLRRAVRPSAFTMGGPTCCPGPVTPGCFTRCLRGRRTLVAHNSVSAEQAVAVP